MASVSKIAELMGKMSKKMGKGKMDVKPVAKGKSMDKKEIAASVRSAVKTKPKAAEVPAGKTVKKAK